ncbi:TPA: hypothetical protein DDZ75_02525 [Patescibacteria group bacterium]|nr:hypothetical protein [Patescibacteria group bacterium]
MEESLILPAVIAPPIAVIANRSVLAEAWPSTGVDVNPRRPIQTEPLFVILDLIGDPEML